MGRGREKDGERWAVRERGSTKGGERERWVRERQRESACV